jgi:dTDP-4-amino-4,6-dideoxygalactose transaminase
MATMAKAEQQAQARQPRVLRLYDALTALDILDDLIEEHATIIEAHGGDIEAVPEIAELLAFAEEQFQSVVERWGLKIRTLLAEAAAANVEASRLAALVARKENAASRLKDFLKRQLVAREIRKISTPMVTVRVQANSRATVRAASETTIEELYAQGSPFIKHKELFSLDSDAVLRAQKDGQDIPTSILVETGCHLRVE